MVVVGAGFAGLAAVDELAGAPVRVTLVDRANFHTFLPLLYQVATAGLNPADVAHPIRGIVGRHPNVRVRQASVVGVDWDDRALHLERESSPLAPLGFDHLVVAGGSTVSYFGIAGAAENAFPLYSLEDATVLRNHVLSCFEAADVDPERADDGLLTFVVVGGGPTGVEVAGALAELVDQVLTRDFPWLRADRSRVRVVLVEMADSLLLAFGSPSRQHALDALRERGVEVLLRESVESASDREVVLASGRAIPSSTLVWAAGVRGAALAEALGVPLGRGGRIDVDSDLSIPGRTDAYAVGDIANIPDVRDGGMLPQLAPVAQQSGRHAARQILARIEGRPTRPVRYVDKGIMATIGRRAAVAELPLGLRLSGTPAWFAWLFLHLVTLVGFRNRLSVFLNWAWNYFTWDRGPRLILGRRR